MSEDTASKTGAGHYGSKYVLNEITFNGDEGKFYYIDKLGGKGEDGKFKAQVIGDKLSVVWLKIRRKLNVFKSSANKGEGMATSEHNHKGEMVWLYGPNERGTAMALRDKYHELRTQPIVYVFYHAKKEVVRFTVKGASLGSQHKHDKKDNVVKFYEYLQSFSGTEHVHEFFTDIRPVTEKGPKGNYYAMSFGRGAKLTDVQQQKVNALIDEVHDRVTKIDEEFKTRMGLDAFAEKPKDAEMDTIQMEEGDVSPDDEGAPADAKVDEPKEGVEYPSDEIDPADIPF